MFNKQYFVVASRVIITQILIFCAILFILWGSQKLYGIIDTTVFPEPVPVAYTDVEKEKGLLLSDAVLYRLKNELNSGLGWSANDIIFNSLFMDNRSYRQYGVYNASKAFFDFFATDMAKLGNSARENESLYAARMNYFALSPSRWGVLFIPSAESSYKKGFSLVEQYKKDLQNDKAVYNARPDDIYNMFGLMLSDRLLGYAIGLLQEAQDDVFYDIDNRIYEVQGMVLVIRDVFNTLYTLYPEVTGKGNDENYAAAMGYLNAICTYDPLLITSTFNSPELVLSYLLFARNRIEDIKESIRI